MTRISTTGVQVACEDLGLNAFTTRLRASTTWQHGLVIGQVRDREIEGMTLLNLPQATSKRTIVVGFIPTPPQTEGAVSAGVRGKVLDVIVFKAYSFP